MDTLGFERVPPRNTNVVLGDTYIVGRRIGLGAMGEVYLAQHARLPGQFAVKMLLPELTGNQDAFARFCREAEIMSQLRHPNIVQIFDFNVAPDGRPYFVMEHLQGRDLEARLSAGPLPLPAITRIVDAVSSALALAHAHGVVHRDLKPANVFLVSVDGQTDELIKVLDFGISKLRSAVQISHAVDVLGTPSYMAPEQARGQAAAIDGRTDQFAVGALAYRMLTGQEPFQGEDTASVLYQVVHQDPPPISLFLPPDWDAGPLQAVLDRALAKQPEQRFGGMMELARAFDDAAERTIGPSGGLTASAARARRLDDADIDPPPPVRTPTPVLLRPKQPAAAAAPPQAAAPALPPVLKPPPQLATTVPRVIDWDGLDTVDEVPKTRVRGVVLALFALGIVALLIATGWYRKLPGAAGAVRQKVHEWTGPSGAAPQSAAPAPTPETAAPAAATAEAPTPPSGAAQPPRAATPAPAPVASTPPPAAPDKPRAHRRSAPRNHRKQAARPAAPTAAEAPRPEPPAAEAAPGTAEAPRPAPEAAPGPAEAPRPAPPASPGAAEAPAAGKPVANPPLNGGAFEIAPPTPMQARPDLAPPPVEEPAPRSP